MYICTECGQEYSQKPEYCDCGNNVFEEKVDAPNKEININLVDKSLQYTKQEQHYERKTTKRIDDKSLVIFLLCIILSILSLLLLGRPSKEDLSASKKEKQKIQKQQPTKMVNIPSIDEIWDNTPPSSSQASNQQVSAPSNISPEPQTIIKTIYKIAPQVSVPNKQTSTVPKKTTSKPINTTATPKKSTSSVQPKTTSVQPKTTNVQPKTTSYVNTAQARQELQNYKISLRNKIASKINFLAIVGDGDCTISFKISNSGKLVNRAFSKQSDNDSLNDAVYNAMMQTPAFNPPPAAYKNETLRLSVRMYGGNFEVDLN